MRLNSGGQILTTTHGYDYLNNRVETVDSYGNITTFAFDEFGRVITTRLPKTIDEFEQTVYPVTHTTYDIAGNPVSTIDAKNKEILVDYNLRGKPIRIQFPDHTEEHYTYHVDGLLASKTEINGIRTEYDYDKQGRPTGERVFDQNNELKKSKTWKYNAFHLSEYTNLRTCNCLHI